LITFKVGDYQKTVSWQEGYYSGNLQELAELIDEVTNSKKWSEAPTPTPSP